MDSKGTLWAGTENGISYSENGVFKNITSANGLGFDNCWAIAEDNSHHMWFGSYDDEGGVSCFNGKNFKRFTTKNGLANNRIRKLLCFNGTMYVGTECGVSAIDIASYKVETLPGAEPHKGVFIVTDFLVINNVVYFSAVNEGIYKIEQNKIKKVLPHSHIYSMSLINGVVYCSNKGYLDSITVTNLLRGINQFSHIEGTILWDYTIGPENEIFAAGWGVFKPEGGVFSLSKGTLRDVSKQYGITSKGILSIIYDAKNKILYCGSKDNGIYSVNLENTINYYPENENPVLSLVKFKDNIVMLCADGIRTVQPNGNTIRVVSREHFKEFEKKYISKGNPVTSHSDGYYELDYDIEAKKIEFYEILPLNEDFIVSSNLGIFKINSQYKIVAYLPAHSYKIGLTPQNKLIETIPYAGVHIYDNAFESLKATWCSENDPNTPVDIVSILQTPDKTYLASIFKGLFVYDKSSFHSYLNTGIFKEPKLKFITKDELGNLIIATEYGDIYRATDKDGSFKILEKINRDKLHGKTITFIQCYKDAIIVGTEAAINIVRSTRMQIIDTEQGFVNKDVKSSLIADNTLWLGTSKGYYKILIAQLLKDLPTVKQVQIGDLKINNTIINPSNWYDNTVHSSLKLSYTENTLEFIIKPFGHKYTDKLRYRFRLLKDANWSPYSNKPLVYLPFLPPGHYNPEVEVMDLYSGKTTKFNIPVIEIAAPFWKQVWFIIFILVFILVVTSTIYYYNRKKIIQRGLIERRLSETRHEALIAQMNPHFTFNAMSSIQNFIVEKDMPNSLRYIGKLAKLMRSNLDNSRKKSITLEDEIAYIEDYINIENMRFDDFISYKIEIDPSIDLFNFRIPAMLLQPFIENVFIHAFSEDHGCPQLSVEFQAISDAIIECKIRDNGSGISHNNTDKIHLSKGTLIVRERLALIQPEIKNALIINSSSSGTEVILLLKNNLS